MHVLLYRFRLHVGTAPDLLHPVVAHEQLAAGRLGNDHPGRHLLQHRPQPLAFLLHLGQQRLARLLRLLPGHRRANDVGYRPQEVQVLFGEGVWLPGVGPQDPVKSIRRADDDAETAFHAQLGQRLWFLEAALAAVIGDDDPILNLQRIARLAVAPQPLGNDAYIGRVPADAGCQEQLLP